MLTLELARLQNLIQSLFSKWYNLWQQRWETLGCGPTRSSEDTHGSL